MSQGSVITGFVPPFSPAPSQYWSMDDADYSAGTFINRASALDGVEVNPGTPTVSFASGQVNQGRSFDATGGLRIMTVPHNVALHPVNFTVSIWLQMSAFSSSIFHAFLGKWSGGTGFALVKNNTGPNSLRLLVGSLDWFGPDLSTLMSINTWANIVFTMSGTTVRMYVDSVEIAGSPMVGSRVTNTQPFEVNRVSGAGTGDQAKYDEVAMWDKALSQAEITAVYNQGVAGMRLVA